MQQYASIIMLVLIIVVFYFLMIRPQNKKAKQIKEMLDNLQVGNRVRTIGGLYGTIAEIKGDDIVVIEKVYATAPTMKEVGVNYYY